MEFIELAAVPVAALPLPALAEELRLGRGFDPVAGETEGLEAPMRASLAAIEARTGRALLARDYRLAVGRLPASGRLALPLGPVRAVLSAERVAADGTRDALEPAPWAPAPGPQPALARVPAIALPRLGAGEMLEIGVTIGMAPGWDGLPPDLRHAALALAAHLFEARGGGGATTAWPHGVEALIAPWRPLRLGRGRA